MNVNVKWPVAEKLDLYFIVPFASFFVPAVREDVSFNSSQ